MDNLNLLEERVMVAEEMERMGGSFVKALGKCVALADLENLRRIADAFPEYWERYRGYAQARRARG